MHEPLPRPPKQPDPPAPPGPAQTVFRPLHPPGTRPAAPPSSSARQPRQRHHAGRAQVLAAVRAAAIDEFSRQGFQGATMQAIAQSAGLTKQQLLYYCGTKDELYASLLHEVVSLWCTSFLLEDSPDTPPRLALRTYIRRKLDLALDHGELSRLFTSEVVAGARYIARYWPEMMGATQQMVSLLGRWMDAGLIRRRDPFLLLQQIWGMTQYYADYAAQVRAMMGPELPREAIAEDITLTVLLACGIEPPPAPTR